METVATQERIVEQAAELFKRYGIRSVTMDDLASHLSMSKKTIYQFFKDKKEVVRVCLSHMLKNELSDMEDIERKANDVIEEMLLLSEYFRKLMRSMNPSLLFDMRKYHPDAWAIYLEQKESCYLTKLQEALTKGKEQGLIRPQINVAVISRMRMETVEMGFNPDIFPSNQYELSEVQQAFFDHFIHGVATQKGLELMQKYMKEEN